MFELSNSGAELYSHHPSLQLFGDSQHRESHGEYVKELFYIVGQIHSRFLSSPDSPPLSLYDSQIGNFEKLETLHKKEDVVQITHSRLNKTQHINFPQ